MKRDNRGRPICEVCAWCRQPISDEDRMLWESDCEYTFSHDICANCELKMMDDPTWKGVA